MVYIFVITRGGGFFSIFHQALEKILYFLKIEENIEIDCFRIMISEDHFIKDKNIFCNLFEYESKEHESKEHESKEHESKEHESKEHEPNCIIIDSSYPQEYFLKSHESPYYQIMKNLIRKNKIKQNIQNAVNSYKLKFNISKNTLAIHIRLTDMNTLHLKEYGYKDFSDYCNHIDSMLMKYPDIDSFYVCSDNNESIHKLILKYPQYRINYIEDTCRVDKEDSDNYNYTIQSLNNIPNIEVKIFTEMLVGSLCTYFICRISDFTNFVILYSDTIKVIDFIN